MVVFPFIIAPLSVARELSIQAVDRALSENRMILLVAQRDKDEEDPKSGDLHEIGTVAVIMRMLKLPDERIRVLVQGVCRARVREFTALRPHLTAKIERIADHAYDGASIEKEALVRAVKRALERASSLGKSLPSEVLVIAANLEDPGRLADLVASNLELKVEEAQEILEIIDPVERLKRVHDLVQREMSLLSMQREIDSMAKDEMDRSQREVYLRHQMKAIMTELGEGNELGDEDRTLPREGARARPVVSGRRRDRSPAEEARAHAPRRGRGRRRSGTTSTGSSACRGARRRRTTSIWSRRARFSTRTTTRSIRSRTGSWSTSPSAS